MSHECEFCKSIFSSKSNLNNHQKSVKYCLDIQKNTVLDKSTIKENIYTCRYCDKIFNLKKTYCKHIETCKKSETVILTEKYENEINQIKKDYEKELKHLKEKFESEIRYKNDIINKLDCDLSEYKNKYESIINNIQNENSETNKYLLEKACSKNSIINTNYNVQFNNMFNELDTFNDENIKLRISQMNTDKIINANDRINDSFLSNFSEVIKDLTFCTDASRGTLIVKDLDGSSEKITSKKFVLECFKKGNNDLINTCIKIHDIITDNPNINVYEQVKMRDDLATIITYLRENNLTSMVTNTANKLIHDCKHLSKMSKQTTLNE